MTKIQRKFLHERPKGANGGNFYGSLFAILLLIAATALVLNHVGLSSVNSGSNDLVGMAVIHL